MKEDTLENGGEILKKLDDLIRYVKDKKDYVNVDDNDYDELSKMHTYIKDTYKDILLESGIRGRTLDLELEAIFVDFIFCDAYVTITLEAIYDFRRRVNNQIERVKELQC